MGGARAARQAPLQVLDEGVGEARGYILDNVTAPKLGERSREDDLGGMPPRGIIAATLRIRASSPDCSSTVTVAP